MWSFGTTMTMANDREAPSAPSAPTPTPTPSPAAASPSPAQSQQIVAPRPNGRSPIFSQRSLSQLGLFFAGATFLGLSTLVTRRAVTRKIRATVPRFFIPSNNPVNKIDQDNSLIAVEALGLATVNVMGFGIMSTGGLAWAFDIMNVEELRALARKSMERSGGGTTDEEAEREVEEWFASILAKKEDKLQKQDDKASLQETK
jgi:hypothetical protein